MTIFYTYPDGAKMTKNFEILMYNIVMPYEKVKGNTGRVLDSPERAKFNKKFHVYILGSIFIRIIRKTKILNFASFN
jgi:hypothetical protein